MRLSLTIDANAFADQLSHEIVAGSCTVVDAIERLLGEYAKAESLGAHCDTQPLRARGLWQRIARGTKYQRCIEERRSAKRRFAAR